MIYFFVKNWKLFLDILLVVGGLIAFTLWDPIGMFTNAKTKQTANLVTGVRDIGQLVTAEYYGEVISSWKEFRLTEFPEDTLTDFADQAWEEIRYATFKVFWVDKGKSKQIATEIRRSDFYKNLPSKNAYKEFIAYLGDKYLPQKLDKIYENEKLKSGIEGKVYDALFKELKQKEKALRKKYKRSKPAERLLYEEEVNNLQFEEAPYDNEFFAYYQFLIKRDIQDEKRKNIVFIGRGSVKAGFDFGTLDESNFLYDEDAKTVNFFGLKPQILDADINPWFIPERKVKGFELVAYSGKVNFEEAKEVKKQCKEKLLDQARKADIVKNAEENGREALKNFFALLLDEPDLKVTFHTHPYDHHMAILKADTLVDMSEALFIDSLYADYKAFQEDTTQSESLHSKSTQHFSRLVSELKTLAFLEKEHQFNFYSMAAAKMMQDTFYISNADFLELIKVRDTISVIGEDSTSYGTRVTTRNAVWFDEGFDFRSEFNSAIDVIEDVADSINVPYELSNLKYFISASDTSYFSEQSWRSMVKSDTMATNLAKKNKLNYQESVRPITRMSKSVKAFAERLKKKS